MPIIIQKVLGAESSDANVVQYMNVDLDKGMVRMWADVAIVGVPLADASSIQYGYEASRSTDGADQCHLVLTAKSMCTRKLQLGLDKMVEQLMHDGQKVR